MTSKRKITRTLLYLLLALILLFSSLFSFLVVIQSDTTANATESLSSDYPSLSWRETNSFSPYPTDKPFVFHFETIGMEGKAEIVDYKITTNDFIVIEVLQGTYTLDVTLTAQKDVDEYFMEIAVTTANGHTPKETIYAISNKYGLFAATGMFGFAIDKFVGYAENEHIISHKKATKIKGELSRLSAEEERLSYRAIIYDFVDMQAFYKTVVFIECIMCGVIIWLNSQLKILKI